MIWTLHSWHNCGSIKIWVTVKISSLTSVSCSLICFFVCLSLTTQKGELTSTRQDLLICVKLYLCSASLCKFVLLVQIGTVCHLTTEHFKVSITEVRSDACYDVCMTHPRVSAIYQRAFRIKPSWLMYIYAREGFARFGSIGRNLLNDLPKVVADKSGNLVLVYCQEDWNDGMSISWDVMARRGGMLIE